ncbi:uncharacterized protein LOC134236536 [Saccostrea cucullata]|uniref:uncharacterized protein LOC134236536 n=1 Tax=Saccostrea cuccullata TaxID=36930 RepID=UPI002ED418BE
MPLKRLSDDQMVTPCDVKGMQTIADLKVAVARILHSSKELIEIVDKENALLYKEDISFEDFLNKEDSINVIVRPSTREEQYDRVEYEDYDKLYLKPRNRECKHNSDPDVLFEIIHRLLVGEEIDIKCPACGNKLITDETFDMCNMSEDEVRFYTDKLKRKRDLIN